MFIWLVVNFDKVSDYRLYYMVNYLWRFCVGNVFVLLVMYDFFYCNIDWYILNIFDFLVKDIVLYGFRNVV